MRIKLSTFIIALLLTPVHAGLWEKITTIGVRTVVPTSEYLIETPGWNIRVYEWTPADNSNIRCLFAAGSQKGGVACYSINN